MTEFRVMVIPEDRAGYVTNITDSLEVFENIIGCECVDMVTRTIGGIRYCILVDDCGLLKDREITAFHRLGEIVPYLVGTLIVTKLDSTGENFVDLSDADLEHIQNHMSYITGHAILFGLDYARPII